VVQSLFYTRIIGHEGSSRAIIGINGIIIIIVVKGA
jgi:hypothetical protein